MNEGDLRVSLLAAAYNGHSECLAILLREGADVNSADFDGTTVLMYAASHNRIGENYVPSATRIDCMRILLENGADVNRVDSKGFSALFPAALSGHDEIVQEFKVERSCCEHYQFAEILHKNT